MIIAKCPHCTGHLELDDKIAQKAIKNETDSCMHLARCNCCNSEFDAIYYNDNWFIITNRN